MEDDSLSSDDQVSALIASDMHYRKYIALRRRFLSIQQETRRLVRRLHQTRRLVARTRRQCRLVATRLTIHGDDYRAAALRAARGGDTPDPPARAEQQSPAGRRKAEKRPRKKRRDEPKKPSNAFLQFCQEQRSLLMSQMKPTTNNLRGLTKQLAANWSTMSADDKQKYVDRYERDKRKYASDMQKFRLSESRLRQPPPPDD